MTYVLLHQVSSVLLRYAFVTVTSPGPCARGRPASSCRASSAHAQGSCRERSQSRRHRRRQTQPKSRSWKRTNQNNNLNNYRTTYSV